MLAGLPPAAAKLAVILSICKQLHSQSPRATYSALTRTDLLVLSIAPKHLSTRRALTSSAPPTSSNPHSRLRHCSPAVPPAYCLPTRFRALALFGRRSPERGLRSSLPASEKDDDHGAAAGVTA